MQKDLIEKCTNRERKAIKESEQLKTVVVKIFNSVRRLLENQLESYEESFGNIEVIIYICIYILMIVNEY